jgi:hypothetical protein
MMKRFLLASLAIVAIGLGLAAAQNITRSVQLSNDATGLVGFSSQNSMFVPNKIHGNRQQTFTVSSFGTNPSPTGTDLAGEVVIGGGSSSGGTITFSQAYPATPYCTATSSNSASPVGIRSSPNGIDVVYNTNATALRFYFICIGARAS